MKILNRAICISTVSLLLFSTPSFQPPVAAQKDKKPPPQPAQLVTRSTTRHETYRQGYGGTVTVNGAPNGSITIEGWDRNEVDITADIEWSASSPADFDRLSMVNNIAIDVDTNHIRIISTGSYDKNFLKRVDKNFPKTLLGLPWKVDLRIKVPAMTDLDISGGSGPVKLAGVEGAIRLNVLVSEAALTLTGGNVSALVQNGNVNVTIPSRGWHGQGADIKVASGTLTIELPAEFSADVNAEVLRNGEIKSSYPGLEARERNSITPRSIRARAGAGGGTLSFTVGDGLLQIKQAGVEK